VVKSSATKELTPKERLLLKKLQKADEEAVKVGQMAKENLQERLMRDTFRREATHFSSSVNIFLLFILKFFVFLINLIRNRFHIKFQTITK